MSKTNIPNATQFVTFTVTGVTLGGQTYTPAGNHDPDGDSDGTVIVVSGP